MKGFLFKIISGKINSVGLVCSLLVTEEGKRIATREKFRFWFCRCEMSDLPYNNSFRMYKPKVVVPRKNRVLPSVASVRYSTTWMDLFTYKAPEKPKNTTIIFMKFILKLFLLSCDYCRSYWQDSHKSNNRKSSALII